MIDRLTCEQVRDRELIQGYAAGRLAESDAEGLEAHAMECAECWAEIQQAVELRAALVEARVVPATQAPAATTRGRWPLALAAAAAVILAIGGTAVWYLSGARGEVAPILRGPSDELGVVMSWQSNGALRISWTPVLDAATYRIKVSSPAGAVVERQVGTPTITLAPLEAPARPATVTVEAENSAGEVVSRATVAVPQR